ncbi:flagellar hook-length control protein FliK [Desulfovirgula thermocuniculi]|uniref:flagellar hook-length control protein FliK n=1 Tax=Desulfovirgula thermocuniculi TaxID=348842 RepID=UPI0004875CA3|nr:flagellar hook-length control protein FliK [Desulfovirgula thermocuniculi]
MQNLFEGGRPAGAPATREASGELLQGRLEAVAGFLRDIFLRHLSEGVTVLRLGLSPPRLGEITLRLQYQKSKGSLAVELYASSEATGRLLSASIPYLQEQLAQHNLKLESFTITVGQEGSTSHAGEGGGGGIGGRPSHAPPVSGGSGAGQGGPESPSTTSLLVDRLV